MATHRILGLGIALFLASTAHAKYQASGPYASYGWIPEYKKLFLRLGATYFKTSDNFDTNGDIRPLAGGNELTDLGPFVEPEYGIAQDWSVKARIGFTGSSLENATALVGEKKGFNDIKLSVKWNLKIVDPLITLEIPLRIPVASSKVAAAGEIPLGDGSFDAGFQLHTGTQSGAFALSLSPGMMFRSGGYAYYAFGDLAFQLDFNRGYIRGFGYFQYPFEQTAEAPERSTGSYARQSISPMGLTGGGQVGIKIVDEFYVEVGGSVAILGNRFPGGVTATIAFFNAFDFFRPLPAKRVKEVPFDSEQPTGDDFYKGR